MKKDGDGEIEEGGNEERVSSLAIRDDEEVRRLEWVEKMEPRILFTTQRLEKTRGATASKVYLDASKEQVAWHCGEHHLRPRSTRS